MSREVLVSEGINKTSNGWLILAQNKNPIEELSPETTEFHEAAHIVGADLDIEDATTIPGPGYKGRTRLKGFNPIAFVAAYALGCCGAGYDIYVLKRLGYNVESLASAARSKLMPRYRQILAVATRLKKERTITGAQAREAVDQENNPEYEFKLTGPQGQERSFVAKVRRGLGFFIRLGLPELNQDPKKQNNESRQDKDNDDKNIVPKQRPYTAKLYNQTIPLPQDMIEKPSLN